MWIKSQGIKVLILIALHMLLHHVIKDGQTAAYAMQAIIAFVMFGNGAFERTIDITKVSIKQWALRQALTAATIFFALVEEGGLAKSRTQDYVPKSQRKKGTACRILRSITSTIIQTSTTAGTWLWSRVATSPGARQAVIAWRTAWKPASRKRRVVRRWSKQKTRKRVRLIRKCPDEDGGISSPGGTHSDNMEKTLRAITNNKKSRWDIFGKRAMISCLRASASQHRMGARSDFQYDTDSFVIAIDTGCSYCMTNNKSHFVGKPETIRVKVKGIGGEGTATMKGTVAWAITNDDGQVHELLIPDTFYNEQAPYCLLSPQHMAQSTKDNYHLLCNKQWRSGDVLETSHTAENHQTGPGDEHSTHEISTRPQEI